jgi:hypothetical protein
VDRDRDTSSSSMLGSSSQCGDSDSPLIGVCGINDDAVCPCCFVQTRLQQRCMQIVCAFCAVVD